MTKPGEKIKTVIDDRGVTLTDTATGLTVTLKPSIARDTVETVIEACDKLGRKLAAHHLDQCTCGPAFLDLPTAWHTKDCPAYHAPEKTMADDLGEKLADLRPPPMLRISAQINRPATGTKRVSLALPEPDPTRYPAEADAYTVATGLRELMLKLAELHSPQALTHTRRMLGLDKEHTYMPGDRLPDGSTYWGTHRMEIT